MILETNPTQQDLAGPENYLYIRLIPQSGLSTEALPGLAASMYCGGQFSKLAQKSGRREVGGGKGAISQRQKN
jgi:hypothetical protein